MENVLTIGDYWGVVGILVSVGLFLVGYRQTIGAKKERVNSANSEVEKILVRRIVLESYTPPLADVSRLLEGKARDFRVRASDLLSEEQLLTSIFTRILESDFLPQDKRDEILRRLNPVMAEAEGEPPPEQALVGIPSSRERFRTRTAALAAMGLAASVVGALIAALPSAAGLDSDLAKLLPVMVATLAASFTVIAVVGSFLRLRESQEETSKADAISRYVGFEREVANVIAAAWGQADAGPADAGYDFAVNQNGKKILIEVKSWSRPMPVRLIGQLAQRLRHVVEREQAAEAIIVTPTSLNVPDEVIAPGVRLMTLRDLRNYLAHSKKG
ncbi:MAG TPA: hypothetical protein VI699_01375 [Candidatus Acidoferrales bacterium]|nr:hypothetical protein [Candidatus Acidoferrales bacterium]